MANWLEEIKAGDTVYTGDGKRIFSESIVTKVTRKRITIRINDRAEWVFNKETGYRVGDHSWNRLQLIQPTQGMLNEHNYKRLRERLLDRVREGTVADLPALRKAAKCLQVKGVE